MSGRCGGTTGKGTIGDRRCELPEGHEGEHMATTGHEQPLPKSPLHAEVEDYIQTLSEAGDIGEQQVRFMFDLARRYERETIVDWLMEQVNKRKPAVPKPDAPFMYHYFLAAANHIKAGAHHHG